MTQALTLGEAAAELRKFQTLAAGLARQKSGGRPRQAVLLHPWQDPAFPTD